MVLRDTERRCASETVVASGSSTRANRISASRPSSSRLGFEVVIPCFLSRLFEHNAQLYSNGLIFLLYWVKLITVYLARRSTHGAITSSTANRHRCARRSYDQPGRSGVRADW